jgi:AcrR family transcriptional regulator
MRRLGAELGVEAMSLYRHVPSRQALLDGVADSLAAEIEPDARAADWPDALRALASEIRALARRHPAAFTLVGVRVLSTPGALAPIEAVLASLRQGGFTPARAISAYRLVIAYARGYALSELAGFAVEAPPEVRYPVIRSLSRRLASEPSELNFRTGIDTIVGGLRAEAQVREADA